MEYDKELSREITAVAKDSEAVARKSFAMAKDNMEEDAEATPGGNAKPKCPAAAHVTVGAPGKAVLQTSTQPCFAALGQYRLLGTTPPHGCTFATVHPEVIPLPDSSSGHREQWLFRLQLF